jgi:uncharacterized protein (TIRG00374 family)
LTSGNSKSAGRIPSSLKYAFSIVLAVLFLYIAFRGVNLKEVIQSLSHASILWIIVLVFSLLISHLLRAIRWKIILNSVKRDTSIKNLFGSLMIGYGVSCVVPRLGEVSRAILVGRWEGLSRSSMFGTVILERIIDVIFLGLAVLLSATIWSENIYVNFPWLKAALYLTTFFMLLFLCFLFFVIKFKEKFYNSITKILGRFSTTTAHKSVYIFEMLIRGFSSLKGTMNYVYAILLSVLIMINYAFNSYIGFYIFGMQAHVTFGMAWILMSISAIGVVIPTPGGLGSYHALAKNVLVILFHFPEAESLAYAVLTHFISYFLFIFTALFCFFLLNKKHDSLFKSIETDIEKL